MLILYDLYFDDIDDIDDEHVGDFDAFSPGHSQYLAFFFDNGGLGDNGTPFARLIFGVYILLLGPCFNVRN